MECKWQCRFIFTRRHTSIGQRRIYRGGGAAASLIRAIFVRNGKKIRTERDRKGMNSGRKIISRPPPLPHWRYSKYANGIGDWSNYWSKTLGSCGHTVISFKKCDIGFGSLGPSWKIPRHPRLHALRVPLWALRGGMSFVWVFYVYYETHMNPLNGQ